MIEEGVGGKVTLIGKYVSPKMARPTATNGVGRSLTNGHPHVTVPGLGLRPQMGIVRIVMCEREGDGNDVIGCEYGHLRLINLYITIGVREKGKDNEKIKKRSQSKVLGKSRPRCS